MTLQAGSRLGPFEILGALGAGGMGEVYAARDTRLGREVALKVLATHLVDSPQARERFQREAQAAAAIAHPNICTLYDVAETGDGQVFLVMERLEGETVQHRLLRGALEPELVIEFGIALADALEVAHCAGIVHRDVKPANILLTERGPKILDFGLAKAASVAAPGASVQTTMASPFVTDPGTMVGTVAYMSPEQLRGEELDPRTDLFSFGLVLYEMATGRPAFSGATSAVVGAAILHQQPPRPREIRPDLLEPLDDVILKALDKDRTLRYQRASEIRADLQRLKRGSGSVDSDPTRERGGRSVVRRATVIAVAAAAIVALAGAGYRSLRRTPVLTNQDTIVLTDFKNTTGDAVFDETLRQGLAVQLEQSPFVRVVSDQRIQQVLRLMGQPANARLTSEVAQGVCARSASAAVVEGSIASLGSQYVLGLRAKTCMTGDVLDDQQVQVARREDVLGALSQMAIRFRTRSGESLATVQRYSTPLEEATTPSLEALKAYSMATKVFMSAGGAVPAQPLFERAVAIDPEFAIAHARLGINYSVVGESTLARQSTIRAYQLRDRASDVERFYIDTFYDRQVTGNLEREQRTLESWTQTYPRDPIPHGLLAGFMTRSTGQYELALASAQKGIALDPDGAQAPAYGAKAASEVHLNRLADAEATVRLATEAHKLEYSEFDLIQYFIAFLNGNREDMIRRAALARQKRGADDMMSHVEALVLARAGRLQEARRMSAVAVDLARRSKQLERAATFETAVAVWEAFHGNAIAARRAAASAIELGRGRDVDYAAAFALTVSGELPRAKALAADLAREYTEDTSVQFIYLPTLRALLALDASRAAAAIEALQPALRFDRALGGLGFNAHFGVMYSVYVRGVAYLAARQPREAAAEFQKILDQRTIVLVDPMVALAQLQLGRALTLAGDTAKAKGAYGELLRLWQDADATLPMLEHARAEYARLR